MLQLLILASEGKKPIFIVHLDSQFQKESFIDLQKYQCIRKRSIQLVFSIQFCRQTENIMYNLCTENVHLDKCSLLEADQQPDMLFTPWMLDWLLWSVTVHMKCSWGINLDPARWTEVGHLQQDLSGIFRSCHHTTGLSLKARKGVRHSLSTKQGQ